MRTLRIQSPEIIDSDGKIIIPDTLKPENLDQEGYYEKRKAMYQADEKLETRDNTIKLLFEASTNPNYGLLLSLYEEPSYRITPKACRFSSKMMTMPSFKYHYHNETRETTYRLHSLHGIVVGNHKYFSQEDVVDFDYNAYGAFLEKAYYRNGLPPKCYSKVHDTSARPEMMLNGCEDFGFDIPPSLHSADEMWDDFLTFFAPLPKPMYKKLSLIADDIEKGIPHCFELSQYMLVAAFMKNMKSISKNKCFQVKSPRYFNKYIYHAKMVCCSLCPVTYDVTIDLSHKILFIKKTGTHLDSCDDYQRKLGYGLVRGVERRKAYRSVTNSTLYEDLDLDQKIFEKYSRGFDPFEKPGPHDIITIQVKDDYELEMKQLIEIIKSKKQYCCQGSVSQLIPYPFLIHEFFRSGTFEGLIVGTDDLVSDLSNQKMFTFQHYQVGYSDCQIVIIAFEDHKTRSRRIACAGFLKSPIPESQMAEFFNALKRLIAQVSDSPFCNLQYIVCANPKMKNITEKCFKGVKCLTPLSIEMLPLLNKHFNDFYAELLLEAMNSRNPINCMAKIHVANYISLLTKDDVTREFLKEMETYCTLWTSSFRKLIPRGKFTGTETDDTVRTVLEAERDIALKSVLETEVIKVAEYKLLKEFYNDAIEGYLSSRKGTSSKLKEIVDCFEKFYGEYEKLMETDTENYGFGMYFSTEITRSLFWPIYGGLFFKRRQISVLALYKPLISQFRTFRRQDINYKLVKTYKYPLLKNMSAIQEYKFNEAMRGYKSRRTLYTMDNMTKSGAKHDEYVCGCTKATCYATPCKHMLRALYESCKKDIKSKGETTPADLEAQADILFERKLENNRYYKRLVQYDDTIMEKMYEARKLWLDKFFAKKLTFPDSFLADYDVDTVNSYANELYSVRVRGGGIFSSKSYKLEMSGLVYHVVLEVADDLRTFTLYLHENVGDEKIF